MLIAGTIALVMHGEYDRSCSMSRFHSTFLAYLPRTRKPLSTPKHAKISTSSQSAKRLEKNHHLVSRIDRLHGHSEPTIVSK